MNRGDKHSTRNFWSADFLSAKDFLRHGVLMLLAFGVLHLMGLREFTSVLNGTIGTVDMNPDNAALLGILYVLFYLGAILLAPILFIAAGLLVLWKRILRKRIVTDEN